jgi:SAM-dependent methyltransferase
MQSLPYLISARSRAKKHAFFLSSLSPKPEDTILDVGANAEEYSDTDNYLEKHYSHKEHITVVTLDDPTALRNLYPEITVMQGDGTNLPFDDNQFTIAYSNAVIEHVGQRDAQLAFLKELYRVSKRGYITTPNRHFPIEVHTRTPLLHLFLPKTLFDTFLSFIGKSWATGDYMYLLSKKDLIQLSLEAGLTNPVITHHRFCGLTMTYSLTWNK